MMNFVKEEEFVYGKLQENLRKSILKGKLDFSSPIKSEFQLCEEYGISRKSVRKALNNLTEEGLLCKIQGKGTFPLPPQKRMHAFAPQSLKIMLSIPDFYMTSNEYDEGFISAVADAAAKGGHTLEYSDHKINLQEAIKEKIDGIIIVRPIQGTGTVREIKNSGIPSVMISSVEDAVYSIVNDTSAELEEPLSILSLLGHKKTAFLNSTQKNYTSVSRGKSYFNAAKKIGIENPEKLYSEASMENILEVLEKLFHEERPTALITGGHYLTGGVLNFCRKYKIRLPEDLSLISINDSCVARNFSVPITVYTEPVQEIGEMSVRLLESILNGKPPVGKKILVKGSLIMRRSCGLPRRRDIEI